MTLPFSAVQNLFSAAVLTATATLDDNANYSGIVQFQVINTGFTGTLDIQGSMHAGGTFVNLPYVIVGAGSLAPAVAQLSYTTDTTNYHIICTAPMPYMKVVMTRSAGSISMWARAYSEPFDLPISAAGGVAAGATDSGNPVKVGGKYNATLPTLTDGQRGDLQLNARGILPVEIYHATGSMTENLGGAQAADGVTNTFSSLIALTRAQLYNGGTTTGWDRQRGNVASTGLASAARVATTPTPDQVNYNGRGAQIMLDVTATPNDAQTLTVTVEVKDVVSSKYVVIASFTALLATTLGATPTTETYVYTLYPGAAETAAIAKHEVQALPLGRTWRVNVLHSAGGSWTYSVGITNIV